METPRVNNVIVVGDPGSDVVRAVLPALKNQGLAGRVCPTVYTAAAVLGQLRAQVALMVAPTRVFVREQAFLVHWAEAICVTCCCLVEESTPLPESLLDPMMQTRVVLCSTKRFNAWLEQYMIQARPSVSCHDDKTSEPLVSAAERAALLGGWDSV